MLMHNVVYLFRAIQLDLIQFYSALRVYSELESAESFVVSSDLAFRE